jgi:rhamnosyltransferase
MDKVLILLSTYNGEKYLPELITSLLEQKKVNIHILVRDDGSTDKTVSLLRAIDDIRLELYIGENKRAVGSFLDLIQRASLNYDYYAFCDQDDVWLDDKLNTAICKLSNVDRTIPSLYYSGQIITDSNLNILYKHNIDTKRSVKANCIFNQMAGCTAVFNQALLQALKKYIPKNVYGHDVWCYRVCAALGGNIVVDSEGRILYRQHGDNVVGLQNGWKGKVIRAKEYIFKYNASSYAEELLAGYADELSDEWVEFLKLIVSSNKSLKLKHQLLKCNAVIFNNKYLRLLFIIKVLIGKI